MQLYYTTSAGEDEEQLLPQASLGGFKSSTAFRNDDFDNMFGEVSTLTVQQNRDQFIAFMLVNESVAKTNVQIWIEKPEVSVCNFKLAAVDPVLKDDVYQMERTREIFNRPVNANFVEADELNKAPIGDLADGQYVGLWFVRSLDLGVVKDNEENFYEEDPENPSMYREKGLETREEIKIHISWD